MAIDNGIHAYDYGYDNMNLDLESDTLVVNRDQINFAKIIRLDEILTS